ncbi:eukaryotic translation initiation factor 3subunit B [Striga asiatica]|uniref:Eukaryotic translation initiation factor 3subunit B n=1 Tax=Striga asiatica TaxID=4170 RepID=A0A5A7R7T7_STRAF|nr:eukaryotic translation initiation factor 3subunit B [Striga asiatica]
MAMYSFTGVGFGNPPHWSKDDPRPPEALHLGSHYVRSREFVLNSDQNGWHHVAPNAEANTFSAHNLCLTRGPHGWVSYFIDDDLRGAEATQEMVTQYASPSAILKIRLYRMTRGNINGRAILREIVFVVNNSGVPQVKEKQSQRQMWSGNEQKTVIGRG